MIFGISHSPIRDFDLYPHFYDLMLEWGRSSNHKSGHNSLRNTYWYLFWISIHCREQIHVGRKPLYWLVKHTFCMHVEKRLNRLDIIYGDKSDLSPYITGISRKKKENQIDTVNIHIKQHFRVYKYPSMHQTHNT